MKSAIAMARNIKVSSEAGAGSVKTVMSIMSSRTRKTVPVRIRLVTIRKPPIATVSLTSFRTLSAPIVIANKGELMVLAAKGFNTFGCSPNRCRDLPITRVIFRKIVKNGWFMVVFRGLKRA